MKELTATGYKTMLIKTLETASEELGNDIPLSTLLLILQLGSGNTPMSQLVKTSKMTGAGVSRTVATLAGYAKLGRREVQKPLLSITDDPLDRRYKMVTFTPAGKAVVDRMLSPVYALKAD